MIANRRSILLAAIVGVLGLLSGTASADFVFGWEGGWYDRERLPDQETWATHYAKHAQVRYGPEKRLANGVLWRLATDRKTGIAMPRIVALPDNSSRDAANHMLEAVQGAAMLFFRQQQEGFEDYLRDLEKGRPDWPHEVQESLKRHLKYVRESMPRAIYEQREVALTYASPRFASLIELGSLYRDEGTYLPRIMRGVTVDIDRRRIFTMEACPEGTFKPAGHFANVPFRFADLLDLCDQERFERFEALLKAAENRMRAAINRSGDAYNGKCRGTALGTNEEFVVYLAVGGLAVHLTQYRSDAETRNCSLMLGSQTVLMLPYRDLEPLMNPGPLREELLKLKWSAD